MERKMKQLHKGGATRSRERSALRFYCVMMAFPILQFCVMWIGVNFNSILLAFKEYDASLNFTWTMDNFKGVFEGLVKDATVRDAFKNSIIFWLVTTIITFPTSLGISYYIYRNYKFSRFIKTILFLPRMISGPVTAIIIYQLMDRGYPVMMKLLFDKDCLGLLANSATQMMALVIYQLFFSLAGNFIFLSSAMSGIDESISEAARVDGANAWQEFIHVTLPLIWPTVSIFLVTSAVSIFTNDYGMYSFYKVAGVTAVNTVGSYFTIGLTEWGTRRYPFFAAFGLVLTAITALIVFPLRAYVNSKNPMNDTDGAIAAKKRMRKEARRNAKITENA
ncbi:MAG: sugar ABC transporter permease [Tyzzerella sp.]|nr:sugar ABC transporter permease [Tyzzerella sp.]